MSLKGTLRAALLNLCCRLVFYQQPNIFSCVPDLLSATRILWWVYPFRWAQLVQRCVDVRAGRLPATMAAA